MREPTPIHDAREGGPFEAGPPAEAATDIGADQDDMSLPVLEVIRTFLLAIVIVGAVALLISSSK